MQADVRIIAHEDTRISDVRQRKTRTLEPPGTDTL